MLKNAWMTFFILLIILNPLNAQTSPNIKTSYDKFKDETVISGTRLFEHFKTDTASVGIGVEFRVSGTDVREPNKFDLMFMEFDDFTKNSDGEWLAIADGERIQLGKILAKAKPLFTVGRLTINQYYGVTSVSPDIFRKLAKAHKVEMRIGNFEITEGRGKLWEDLQSSRQLYRDVLDLIDREKK